jgi:3-hydroxyisobutyrate dehydrogenase-like beta-hydroxyacid dehydrogenase
MIGMVHPGDMGSAVARVLVDAGHEVAWASEGRSDGTRRRAAESGLVDVGSTAAMRERCEVVLSVCPPHAAIDTAADFRGYTGLFADLNAVSPETAAKVGEQVTRFVDGGIVGPPPLSAGTTRLYLAGEEAGTVAELFAGTHVDARVLDGRAGDASALKMVYAAWTKGTTAMLLAVRAAARSLGVEDELVAEWELSQPDLPARSERSALLGLERGWRWAFELDEVGRTFDGAGLPGGFGAAAGEVFARLARTEEPSLAEALDQLVSGNGR